MQVQMVYEGQTPVDITDTVIGSRLAGLVTGLRGIGESRQEIEEACVEACEAETVPLLVEEAELHGDILRMHCEKLEVAEKPFDWTRFAQGDN